MPPHCVMNPEEWWKKLSKDRRISDHHHLMQHWSKQLRRDHRSLVEELGQFQHDPKEEHGKHREEQAEHRKKKEEEEVEENEEERSSSCCHPARTPPRTPCTWVEGAIIVGAGPSGMATAACLQQLGIKSSILLEKSDCIASLWQNRTYDRLRLHLPKKFCELPMAPFPSHFPTYPTKQQFLDYLDEYARRFRIQPRFRESVQSARFDPRLDLWRVETIATTSPGDGGNISSSRREYVARWLVVATGENAEARIPAVPGQELFAGKIRHSSRYRNGEALVGQRVLVVGAGNSGMEIAMDLVQHGAQPSIVVRSPIHILPREILGASTFGVSVAMLKLLPLWLTDRLLLLYALLALGDTSRYGIRRPKTGPMELKAKMGKTPVLDIGALDHIKRGNIQVVPAIESFTPSGVKFVNGEQRSFDSIVLATGYRPNVPNWLKDPEVSFSCDGFPTCGWKAGRGLYVAGLSRKGILGVSRDAQLIADDIFKSHTCKQHQTSKGGD